MKKLNRFIAVLLFPVLFFSGCGGDDNPTAVTQSSLIGTWKFISIIMTDWQAESQFGAQYKDVEFKAAELSPENNSLVVTVDRFALLLDFFHPTILQDGDPFRPWGADREQLSGLYVLTGSTLSVIDESNNRNVTITASISNNRLILESDHSFVENRTFTAGDEFKKIVWERQ